MIGEFSGIQFHQYLALLDAIVYVDQHALDGTGQFAADIDRPGRMQRAVGCDAQRQAASMHGLGDVDGRGANLLLRLPVVDATRAGKQGNNAHPKQGALPPAWRAITAE